MVVADGSADLARGEVQNARPVHRLHERPRRPGHDPVDELPSIADEQAGTRVHAGRLPRPLAGRFAIRSVDAAPAAASNLKGERESSAGACPPRRRPVPALQGAGAHARARGRRDRRRSPRTPARQRAGSGSGAALGAARDRRRARRASSAPRGPPGDRPAAPRLRRLTGARPPRLKRSPLMAIQESPARTGEARQTVLVDTFTNGLLGPEVPMLGPVADGGHVVWNSTPGCWGPMITPSIRGGHGIPRLRAVDGAKAGDAVVIRIKDIEVTSLATSSGNDQPMEGRFNGDPYCAPVCPGCGTEWPETRVEGIGQESVRCTGCGADCTPFTFTNGYTMAFDELRSLGVTVPREAAEGFAREAARFAALPDNSVQNPILGFAPHDIVAVRAGAILVCPVKLDGAGIYLGDMHALQGDGEIAGHTCDASGAVTLQVEVLKALGNDGPILFPLEEDLPFLARPLSRPERERALALARRHGMDALEESLPILSLI